MATWPETRSCASWPNVLRGAIRSIDLVCRWGSEEFVVMLIGSDASRASQVAERIRIGCAEARVLHDGREIRATVSVGVAECLPDTTDAVVARADQALYQAKAAGRNRVEVAPGAGGG